MTLKEFEEKVKDFSLEKENLEDKVNELFGDGFPAAYVAHFVIEQKNCRLSDVEKIFNGCPNYIKRYGKSKEKK
ncbi:hypothetical protein [Chryseobacterium luquanense]|uniref:Uncharacterized protein n=1 Tax=Chryseobacterium luquanense TaxID=2983766 RepID=A0ABT3Y559_9FLAO|nr:hypothetical protein [Chryseobacterium luquanense]MCX8533289.1 hypothetical protein [Chryseobacterium luquanense]